MEVNECEKLLIATVRVLALCVGRMKRRRFPTGISGQELKLLLSRLCEAAHKDVSRMPQHEAVAVHQLRLRMKKIQALLRLAADAIDLHSMRALRHHIRCVKTACAASREEAVRMKIIEKLVHKHHLSLKPRQVDSTVVEPPAQPAYLRHQLHALEQLVARTPIEKLSHSRLVAQHVRCYRKGRRLMRQSTLCSDEATLHRWRHRVKDFYFQTLLFAQAPGARRRLHRARRLGTLLGREHDFATLSHETAFCSRRGPWPDIIQEKREALRQRCLHLGHKLYATQSSRLSGMLAHAA